MTAKNAATTATAAIGKWKLAKDVASENVAAQDSHRNFNLRRLCCRGVEGVGSAAPDKVRTRRVCRKLPPRPLRIGPPGGEEEQRLLPWTKPWDCYERCRLGATAGKAP